MLKHSRSIAPRERSGSKCVPVAARYLRIGYTMRRLSSLPRADFFLRLQRVFLPFSKKQVSRHTSKKIRVYRCSSVVPKNTAAWRLRARFSGQERSGKRCAPALFAFGAEFRQEPRREFAFFAAGCGCGLFCGSFFASDGRTDSA